MTAAEILRALPAGVVRNEAELATLLEAAYGEPGVTTTRFPMSRTA